MRLTKTILVTAIVSLIAAGLSAQSILVAGTQTPFKLTGQLLRFDSPSAAPAVVAGGLIGPTGLAYEATRNELIVTETFTGLVKRIALTP